MFYDSRARKHLDFLDWMVDSLIWRAMNFMESKYGQNGERRFRKCKGCGERFFSTGNHHRFCKDCRAFLYDTTSVQEHKSEGGVRREPVLA